MAAKDKVVKLDEKVKVIGTGKYKMLDGKEYLVHPLNAEKLIKKGACKSTK